MSDVCAGTLTASGWLKPRELGMLPRRRWRAELIRQMEFRGFGEQQTLVRDLNDQLALTVGIYLHLAAAGVHPRQAAAMTPTERREALLVELAERTGTAIDSRRDCDDNRLLAIAESGLLRERLKPLVVGLEAVGGAAVARFGLTDDAGRTMDSLKILPLAPDDNLGIYHARVDDAFRLFVARSSNLVDWSPIADLGSHNHQGDIKPLGDGFIVANEQDEPRRGNHLRFRYFQSLEQLMAAEPSRDINISRTLSRLNEGTPDIRLVEGEDPDDCSILVGFHYYRRAGVIRKVDRLAAGVLNGFQQWTAWIDTTANRGIERLGFTGNIGGRSSFLWDNSTWFIQEAQRRWKDWSSWRVLLGNGRSYIQLEPRTPGASRSFANPGLARLPHGGYAATLFLPHQGNVTAEEGELVFSFDMSH